MAPVRLGQILMLPAIVLASASPARLQLLRNVGIEPAVVVSDIDETAMVAAHKWKTAEEIAGGLAVAKAEHVATTLLEPEVVIIGCDSMMEFDGHLHGKPGDAAAARHRLAEMSGGSGFLHTGHHVIHNSAQGKRTASAVTSTEVVFTNSLRPKSMRTSPPVNHCMWPAPTHWIRSVVRSSKKSMAIHRM